jgi:ADP-ribose pyrophosphatase
MIETSPLLLKTKRFDVVQESYPDNHGGTETREIVRHPGSAVIVPLFDNGHVCLERVFRVSVGRSLVELPAGTLSPGEDPLHAAHRELKEETGFQAERMEPLHEFYVSPGILNERLHMFLATGLTAGQQSLDAGEKIEIMNVPWAEAIDMVFNGAIEDAKTIAGLLFVNHLKQAGKLPQRVE